MKTKKQLVLARRVWYYGVLVLMLALACGRAEPSTVAIVKGDDPDQMVAQAVELLGGLKDLFQDGKTVVIKPNLTGLGVRGKATDWRVGRGLVKAIKKTAQCQLSFAEGLNEGGLWEGSGFAKVAKEENVALVNTEAGKFVPVKIDGFGRKEYRYPELVMKCDVLVDLPVMKTHRLTGISIGMKNLYGFLPVSRWGYHDYVEKATADLLLLRKPDLVLVDALVGMEGQGPLDGTSLPMGLVVAGRDVVAVDTVCAALMGIDPGQVEHINLAHEKGLGENDLGKIVVKGVAIDQVKKSFKLALASFHLEMPGTAELAKRIQSLADKVTGTASQGLSAQFNAARLKVDRSKYPKFEPSGFSVSMDGGGSKINFDAQYVVPSLDNRRATEESIKTWIKENLGELTAAVPTVSQPAR